MTESLPLHSPEHRVMRGIDNSQNDENLDNSSIQTDSHRMVPAVENAEGAMPTVATPEDDNDGTTDREVAVAAAEVSVMGQASRTQRREPTGDEALIGATANADGVGSFEMIDESGELVKDRFLQFLME